MNATTAAAALLILLPLAVNTAFAALAAKFDYPDITSVSGGFGSLGSTKNQAYEDNCISKPAQSRQVWPEVLHIIQGLPACP